MFMLLIQFDRYPTDTLLFVKDGTSQNTPALILHVACKICSYTLFEIPLGKKWNEKYVLHFWVSPESVVRQSALRS